MDKDVEDQLTDDRPKWEMSHTRKMASYMQEEGDERLYDLKPDI